MNYNPKDPLSVQNYYDANEERNTLIQKTILAEAESGKRVLVVDFHLKHIDSLVIATKTLKLEPYHYIRVKHRTKDAIAEHQKSILFANVVLCTKPHLIKREHEFDSLLLLKPIANLLILRNLVGALKQKNVHTFDLTHKIYTFFKTVEYPVTLINHHTEGLL